MQAAVTKWKKEVQDLGPKCPLLLVGMKIDSRDHILKEGDADKVAQCVSEQEARDAADKHCFSDYVECSAKTSKNLNKVFYKAQKMVLQFRENEMKLVVDPSSKQEI